MVLQRVLGDAPLAERNSMTKKHRLKGLSTKSNISLMPHLGQIVSLSCELESYSTDNGAQDCCESPNNLLCVRVLQMIKALCKYKRL